MTTPPNQPCIATSWHYQPDAHFMEEKSFGLPHTCEEYKRLLTQFINKEPNQYSEDIRKGNFNFYGASFNKTGHHQYSGTLKELLCITNAVTSEDKLEQIQKKIHKCYLAIKKE